MKLPLFGLQRQVLGGSGLAGLRDEGLLQLSSRECTALAL